MLGLHALIPPTAASAGRSLLPWHLGNNLIGEQSLHLHSPDIREVGHISLVLG